MPKRDRTRTSLSLDTSCVNSIRDMFLELLQVFKMGLSFPGINESVVQSLGKIVVLDSR